MADVDPEDRARTREIIANAREVVDGIVKKYGDAVIKTGGDTDAALVMMTNALIDANVPVEEAILYLAFATRRLWIKRSQQIRFSLN